MLNTAKFTAVMTGDAGKEAEAGMLDNRWTREALEAIGKRDDVKVILKVGHHGSKTATSEEFLDAVKPDAAVISCGFRNVYGHPHREVLELLNERGIEVHRTDLDGAKAN